MPKASAHKSSYNFSSGLSTEQGPFTGEENSLLEVDNFDIDISGKITRRLGVDMEANGLPTANHLVPTDDSFSTYEWRGVNGLAGQDFLVMQHGPELWFWDLAKEPLSDGYINTIDLTSSKVTSEAAGEFSYTAGKGVLFVVGENIDPVYITYLPFSTSFISTTITVEVRDFVGVEDDLEIDERPGFLTAAHEYNLRNQGWPTEFSCANTADGSGGVSFRDPLEYTKTLFQNNLTIGRYPSNADIMHLAKMSAAVGADVVGAYHPFNLNKISLGKTRAPRGNFILNAFVTDRVAASSIPGVESDVTNKRPTQTAFFGGRVWYGGVQAGDWTGRLYYSQLVTDLDVVGRCYQDQNPTAEILNELLDTDGGVVEIPEMGHIDSMVELQDRMLILTSTGVWSLRGGADTGFTPSSFSVQKISSIGTVNHRSIVDIGGAVFYWAEDGIHLLSFDQTQTNIEGKNITKARINTLYQAISGSAKKTCQGFFDKESNKLFWGYNSAAAGTSATELESKFDKFLILDLTLSAFYTYTVAALTGTTISDPCYISAIIRKPSLAITKNTQNIQHNGDNVVVNGVQVAQSEPLLVSAGTAAVKLLVMVRQNKPVSERWETWFAEFRNTSFKDWDFISDYDGATGTSSYSYDISLAGGVSYESALKTGYDILGDGSREKQLKFLVTHFERTEQNFEVDNGVISYDLPSSGLLQVQFDWTDSAAPGRWTTEEEAYKLNQTYVADSGGDFDYGFTVISSKKRVRGHGRAVAFKLRSSPGKDCRLLGWDAEYTARTRL